MEGNVPGSLHQNLTHFVQNLSPEGLGNPVAEQKKIFIFAPFAQSNQNLKGSVGGLNLRPFQDGFGFGRFRGLRPKQDVFL